MFDSWEDFVMYVVLVIVGVLFVIGMFTVYVRQQG